MEEIKINNLIVHCFKCKKASSINVSSKTKYWSCPNCKQMNKCENLIKQTLKDTVLDAKLIDDELE
jgi:hypothetical protein